MTAVQARKTRVDTTGKDESINIEIREMDTKGFQLENGWLPDSKRLPTFDFERLARFMSHGFLNAIIQHRWFAFLKHTFPLTTGAATTAAFKRMTCDQLVFAPVGLGIFFTYMTVTEGGGRRELKQKLRDVYFPSLKANYLVWPAVQMLNFRLVPIQFQIVSCLPPGPIAPPLTILASCLNSQHRMDRVAITHKCSRGCQDKRIDGLDRVTGGFVTMHCEWRGRIIMDRA